MTLKIEFELDDDDLARLGTLFQQAREKAGAIDQKQLLQSARELLDEDLAGHQPEFVREQLEGLKKLVDMVEDESWSLPAEECDRVTDTLAYFVERNDAIPDETPVLGLLDDAVAAKLVLSGLEHELEAYHEFTEYRSAEAQRRANRGLPTDVSKEDWLADRRSTLHSRMRARRAAGAAGWHTSLFGWHID